MVNLELCGSNIVNYDADHKNYVSQYLNLQQTKSMKYTLELDIREEGSNVVFNTIFLNSFKVNIVERYSEDKTKKLRLREVLFKVRTLDDQLIKKKDGNLNTYIRDEAFMQYQKVKNVFSSYQYRKKLINKKEAEQDLVHFILSMVVSNYELN